MNFCNNCGNKITNHKKYCDNCESIITQNNQQKNIITDEHQIKINNRKSNIYAIISFILSIIPIIIFCYCLYYSGGEVSENTTKGSTWWLMAGYICTLGIPVMVCSYMLADKSNKLKVNLLANISILIIITPPALLILLIFFLYITSI